mmetsp:Transcript_23353/g.49974  ORF Transcript_23353/g.49974 Transcript_23353/m.49974 type:complete len:138 (-) Transcript_23353:255-668(-)
MQERQVLQRCQTPPLETNMKYFSPPPAPLPSNKRTIVIDKGPLFLSISQSTTSDEQSPNAPNQVVFNTEKYKSSNLPSRPTRISAKTQFLKRRPLFIGKPGERTIVVNHLAESMPPLPFARVAREETIGAELVESNE